jgi:hypothetical protein
LRSPVDELAVPDAESLPDFQALSVDLFSVEASGILALPVMDANDGPGAHEIAVEAGNRCVLEADAEAPRAA